MEANEDFMKTVGGMVPMQKTVFDIPEAELRSYYLKTAFLTCPDYCVPRRTERQMLNHLYEEQKKVLGMLTHLMRTPWKDGIPALHEISAPYLMQAHISLKERRKVCEEVSGHIRFLSNLVGDYDTMRLHYALYVRHYNNLKRLLKKEEKEE